MASALRDDFLPVRPASAAAGRWPPAAARGVDVGFEEQHRPVVADKGVLVLEIVDQLDRHGVRLGQIANEDALALVGSPSDGDHQIAAVVRDRAVV